MNTKEAYIDKLEAQLKEWSAKIDGLEAKADRAGADARIKLSKEIDKLKKNRTEAKNKINELKEASEDAWEELKEGAENIWKEYKSTLDNVLSIFR
jgi:uncharacterized coiled-coil DUF342 family protein